MVAVYDVATGAILRTVRYPPNVAPSVRPGEAWVEVGPEVSDTTHKIENGVPVLL